MSVRDKMPVIQCWGLDLSIDGLILLRLSGLDRNVNSFPELKTVLFVAHSPLETNADSFLAMIWAKRFQDGSPPLWHIECPISKFNPLTFPGFSFSPWPSETQPKFSRSHYPHFGIFGRGCLLRTSQEDNQIRGLASCLEFKSLVWKSQGELVPGQTINLSKEGFARLHLRNSDDLPIENCLYSQNIQYWPHVEVFALERINLPKPIEKPLMNIPFSYEREYPGSQEFNNFVNEYSYKIKQVSSHEIEYIKSKRTRHRSPAASSDSSRGLFSQILYSSGNIFLSLLRWLIYTFTFVPRIF